MVKEWRGQEGARAEEVDVDEGVRKRGLSLVVEGDEASEGVGGVVGNADESRMAVKNWASWFIVRKGLNLFLGSTRA